MSAKTFYIYGRGKFGSRKLGLYKLTGKPHGTRIKLSAASPYFSYSTIVSASNLSATPQEALDRYRREISARIDRLIAEEREARKELEKIPRIPPAPEAEADS